MSSRLLKKDIEGYEVCKSGEHTIYKMPALKLIQLSEDGDLDIWSKNRPPDDIRVSTIREYQQKTGHVNGVIHLAYVAGEGLVCFEGNHRRMALIPEIQTVLVDILWDVTQERIVQEFTAINQAVSVSSLYTDIDFDATARCQIQDFVNKLGLRFKAFLSPNARPNRPNFNKEVLSENISQIWKMLGCSVKDLVEAIEKVNYKYSTQDHSDIKSPKIIEKCAVGGLWLFAVDTQLNHKHIQQFIN
jgi:hypothetical protein